MCPSTAVPRPIAAWKKPGRGLEEAISIAQYTGGRLRLVHVIDELSFSIGMDAYAGYSGDWLSILRENAAAILQQAMSTVVEADIEANTVHNDSLSGLVHILVTAEASRWRADLIVRGTHGRRGVGRMLLGSRAKNILRYSTVPVLLVHASQVAEAAETADEAAHLSLRAGESAML